MLSADRLKRLRGALLQGQANLREQIASLNATSQGVNLGPGNHMAEDATAAFDQATAVSLRRSHQIALEEIERALQRMDAGVYGICQRCGAEIDFARLKALPQATLCMACQRAAEM